MSQIKIFCIAFTLLILCFQSSFASSKGSAYVAKVFSDKRRFIFQKTFEFKQNSLIAMYDMPSKKLYEARVLECKQTSCLASLSNKEDSFQTLTHQDYKVYYNFENAKTPKIVSAHYGTPLGSGFRMSYRQEFRPKLYLGAIYGLVRSDDYSHVELSAHLFSIYASYHFLSFKGLDFNLIAEAGYALSELNFRFEDDALDVKENTHILSGSVESIYNINSDWGLGFKAGASMNGLKSSYAWELGTFSNPYGKMLIFFEAGLYHRF